jgi:ABC-type siderophore export system fused ATPase/permease subunit
MTIPNFEFILVLIYPAMLFVAFPSTEAYLILMCPIMLLITILIIMIVVVRGETKKAMISGEREEEYLKLAEQAIDSQKKSATEQRRTAEELEDIRNRVANIEKILREVE